MALHPDLNKYHIRQRVMRRDHYTCRNCGKTWAPVYANGKTYLRNCDLFPFIVDHIRPLSMGGEPFALSNLQLLCVECHRLKTVKDLREIREYKKKSGTYFVVSNAPIQ